MIALEPDLRKTFTAFKHSKVKFVAGYDQCIRGQFDAVVMYDVIYRVPPPERDALISRIYDRVKPGGTFVLKDLDPSSRLKWHWNRFQETTMDRLFGLTIGEAFYVEIDTREQIGERMARAGFTDFQWKRVDFGYPHAHIIYTARRPLGDGDESPRPATAGEGVCGVRGLRDCVGQPLIRFGTFSPASRGRRTLDFRFSSLLISASGSSNVLSLLRCQQRPRRREMLRLREAASVARPPRRLPRPHPDGRAREAR